jgi:ATP-dependent helicase HepA
MTEKEIQFAVEQFETIPYQAVLVCDRSGEEGLNLQYAHAILHLDLPLAPARLEQRIGRLDRFGRQEPLIYHRVIVPSDEDGSSWYAWFELLRDAFHVFNESIADVQFLLSQLQEDAALALFRLGADGLRSLQASLRDRLAAERDRLDDQYALDQLALGEEEGDTLVADLAEFERDEQPFAAALGGWIIDAMQFRRERLDQPAEAFSLHWGRNTLIPTRPWKSWFADGLDRPLTYSRQTAIRRPEARLVRPGFPLVERLQQFLRRDDRGTAFATWRYIPDWPEAARGTWLGFRLCFVVEVEPDVLADLLQGTLEPAMLTAVRRRADEVLLPWQQSITVDIALHEVTDSELLAILDQPYRDQVNPRGGRDYNLGSRPDALWDCVSPDEFARLCRSVRQKAESLVRESEHFAATIQTASKKAREDLGLRNDQLRRRDDALRQETGSADPDNARQIRVNEAIMAAVESPAVRLDAIGFMIVSDRPPSGGRHDGSR